MWIEIHLGLGTVKVKHQSELRIFSIIPLSSLCILVASTIRRYEVHQVSKLLIFIQCAE